LFCDPVEMEAMKSVVTMLKQSLSPDSGDKRPGISTPLRQYATAVVALCAHL